MNYSRWFSDWRFGFITYELSIIDLVNSGTLDCKLAGLLWLLMEQRPSVLVAAGPSYAGKSTLFHTLLDFLRPEVQQVSLNGWAEDFTFVNRTKPRNTYLVAEEISSHGFSYLWGYQATEAFRLISRGYALGATVHARSAKDVVYMLNRSLGIPLSLIAEVSVIVTLQVMAGENYEDEPLRRVDTVSLLYPSDKGLTIQTIATRRQLQEGFSYLADDVLQETLARRFPNRYGCLSFEISERERFLNGLRLRGVTSREEVREAIVEYYALHTDDR
jgi:hypothetical protein